MDITVHALQWVRRLFAFRPSPQSPICPAASAPRTPAPAVAPTTAAIAAWPRPVFDASVFDDPVFDGEREMVRPYVLLYQQRRERQRQAGRYRVPAPAGTYLKPRYTYRTEVTA